MLKKLSVVSAIAGLVLVGPSPAPSSAADYKHSGCSDAAKVEFPDDHAARKDFKHWCKDQWKIYEDFARIRLSVHCAAETAEPTFHLSHILHVGHNRR